MSLAINNSTVVTGTLGTSVTFSYTSSSGSDRLILTRPVIGDGSGSITGVTYNGDALTIIGSFIWGKAGQATGANNLAVSFSSYEALFTATSDWTGVDQTTPVGAEVIVSSWSSSPSTGSITCPSGGAVWGGMWADYTTGVPTAGSGTTLAGAGRNGGSGFSVAGGYRVDTGAINFNLSGGAGWHASGVPINAVAGAAADISGTATLGDITASGGMSVSTSDVSGSATLGDITAAGTLAQASGTITSPVLKNNTGTILASVTGIVANVYHPTTGALVVRKTGLSSSGAGVVTITDVLIVAGTTYAYELDLSATSQGRRLPTGVAA